MLFAFDKYHISTFTIKWLTFVNSWISSRYFDGNPVPHLLFFCFVFMFLWFCFFVFCFLFFGFVMFFGVFFFAVFVVVFRCMSSFSVFSPMLPASFDCPYLIAPSVFSNVYLDKEKNLLFLIIYFYSENKMSVNNNYKYTIPECIPILHRTDCSGLWRILNILTESRMDNAILEISLIWSVPLRIGNPDTTIYASPIVSTCRECIYDRLCSYMMLNRVMITYNFIGDSSSVNMRAKVNLMFLISDAPSIWMTYINAMTSICWYSRQNMLIYYRDQFVICST